MQACIVAFLILAPVATLHDDEKANTKATAKQTKDGGSPISRFLYFPNKEDLDRNALRNLPKGWDPNIVQLSYELLIHRVNPPRFYPLVGDAKLVELQFRCTIINGQVREYVYMDFDHLVTVE